MSVIGFQEKIKLQNLNILKVGAKLLLSFFIIIFSQACEDKSYFKKIYDEELYLKKIKCLKLKLNPFNKDVYNNIKDIYKFSNNCKTTLEIRYKTNIGCNSPYSTNKSYHSFIELNLVYNNKIYYTLYKDLKDENINDEIKKAFKYLRATLH